MRDWVEEGTVDLESWPLWRCCYRQRGPEERLWRGEAADILPHPASPLTASVYTAAQPHLSRTLATWLDTRVSQLWDVSDGVLFLDTAGWQALSAGLSVPYGMMAHLLGLPGADPRTEPLSRRLWGILPPPNPGKRWISAYAQAAEALAHVQRWVRRVLGYRWTQAEVLQVMEEVAPRVGEVLAVHTVATLALSDVLYRAPTAQPEEVYARLAFPELPTLAPVVAAKKASEDHESSLRLPWGGRSPFEVAAAQDVPREAERISVVLSVPELGAGDDLWTAVSAWLYVRERAREALAWVTVAIRAWTLAAAAEGMSDGRLQSVADVFLLELEEIKQMMTGEWSDPEPIHRLTEARRTQWPTCEAPPALDKVTWLEEIPAARLQGSVWGAPGWHPDLGMLATATEGIAALSSGLLAYGRLLAHVQGLAFYSARD